MSNNKLQNYGMLIPSDVVRRDDGQPAKYIAHKREFIEYMRKEGRLIELQQMTWAQRDEAYSKWIDTMEIIPATQEKQPDGSFIWTRERIQPKHLNQ